jgi:hypothetical protein
VASNDAKRSASPAGRNNRPVRFTLDLAREQHRFLKLFAVDAETDASVVVRTLLALLAEDAALARRVLRRVAP